MKRRTSLVAFVIVTVLSVASAQVATGTPPYGSFGGGPFDIVNLGNLNVHFSIPVVNKAGRGLSFYYNLSNDTSVWTPVVSSGTTTWTPDATWGWLSQTDAATGYIRLGGFSFTSTFCTYNNITHHFLLSTTTYSGFVDRLGTFHHVPGLVNIEFLDSTCTINYTGASGMADDGSGYGVSISPTIGVQAKVTARNGGTWDISPSSRSAGSNGTDANGNMVSTQVSGSTTTFFDTLSSTTPVITLSGTAPSPVTYTYTAPGASATSTISYKSYTVQTSFKCTNITEYGPTANSLVDKITLADGSFYQFTYETTPIAGSTNVTGRIASVRLPTGGIIDYTYTGGNGGINCGDGSTIGLNRTLSPGGEWQYVRTKQADSAKHWQTEITTPPDAQNPGSVGDQTVIDFQEDSSTVTPATNYFFETQRKIYQGNASGTPLGTVVKCYNAHYATCPTTAVSSPIIQTDVYSQLPNGSNRLSEVQYNIYGLVTDDKEYDYGAKTGSAPGTTKRIQETAISYASLGNGIVNRPSSVNVYDWSSGTSSQIASTSYTYDGTEVTTTTGTPQHVSVTGSRGNLTMLTTSTSNTATLSRKFSYYDTGTLNVATDVNGAQTTYVYSSASNPYNGAYTASCGNSFPTSVNEPVGLSRSTQWRCVGGVIGKSVDENGNSVTPAYTDLDFWRPAGVTDQTGAQTNISYIGQTAVEKALQSFNGGSSAWDFRTTVDGFGRLIFSQQLQSPSSEYYDTHEFDYNVLGQPYRSTMPYSATASPSSDNTTAPATQTTYDALGRVTATSDGGGGAVSYTYTNNDVLQKVTGTQIFQKQFEYDGLGRLTSVCEMSSTLPHVGACGQSVSQTGYLTKYSYDALGHLLGVNQNSQPNGTLQTRTFAYDWLGRMTSEINPESGLTTYVYDSYPAGTCGWTSEPGDLMLVSRSNTTSTCYVHDGLHRVTYSGDYPTDTCRVFRYDNSQGVTGTRPAAITSIKNSLGRMVEAETDNCTAFPPTTQTMITDEWFSYSARGEITDFYESTTPSTGSYFHTTASFWANGALETIGGIPGVPAIYYGTDASQANYLDGEGRYLEVAAGTGTSPVTGVTYSTSSTTNPLGALTNVTFGSSDSDSFTYDPNTGRMASYTFSVNGNTDKGTLQWNPNGTLTQLAITDNIPGTSDSQTCNYLYDDLLRISQASCGALWGQSFSYDAFGNITKNTLSGANGLTFTPGYSSGNQFSSIPGVNKQYYDGAGNLVNDNLNNYTWNGWNNMVTVTPYGGSTVTVTYDALGRALLTAGGTNMTILYGPTGQKLATLNGQTLIKAFMPLPGGAEAIYNTSGLAYFRHSDWLGTSRLTSMAAKPTSLYSSTAYAPFGEQYSAAGTADASFTGQDQDTLSSLYDFPARRQSPSQGRWISPDPAGLAAVILMNPQSWNRYAYVDSHPLRFTDPTGLVPCCGPGNTQPTPTYTADECAARPTNANCEGTAGENGYDIFDAIEGAVGSYLTLDMYGQVSFGFSEEQWQAYYAAQTYVQYYFTGGNGTVLEKQTELAAIQFGQEACRGQDAAGLASCIQQVYDQLALQTNPSMQGGNYDFRYADTDGNSIIQINGQFVSPSDFACALSRCGIIDSLDYSHGDGTFHVDTANPLFIPLGSLIHFGWDVVGGDTVWSAGGIPRPWW